METMKLQRRCVVGLGSLGIDFLYRIQEAIEGIRIVTAEADFLGITTDDEEFEQCKLGNKLLIGGDTSFAGERTKHDIQKGAMAVISSKDDILGRIKDYDEICIICGIGGGTGAGAIGFLTKWALESGIKVCIKAIFPFDFEGPRVIYNARIAIEQLEGLDAEVVRYELNELLSELQSNNSLYLLIDTLKKGITEDVLRWASSYKLFLEDPFPSDEEVDEQIQQLKMDLKGKILN